MKIIHLTSGGDVGGAKTHVLSLLNGLNQTQTVRLVCFMEGDFANEARELGIPTTVMAGKNLTRVCKELSQLILKEGFEIIHCHGARANMMAWLIKRKVKLPVVTTVHTDYLLDYMGRPLGKLTYGNINRMALRRLDYHIGVSDTLSNLLISRGFDAQRIFSIYNGVDFTPRTPAKSREEFLRSYGVAFDEHTTIFGIAARINPVKDMTTLVKAFARAKEQNDNIRLLIAGEGEEEETIKQLASRLCTDGSVTFLGWLGDTDSFYNALDVNTLSSVSEGFPYALPEGARWHCATIASNVGGVPYMIDSGVNGYLFQPKDEETMAKYMVRFANNPDLCRQMGQRLYDKTAEQFSVDATVNRQLEIYRTILRRKKRGKSAKDGAVISGAYGRGNAGDEALLHVIVSQLRQIDPDMPLCVLTRSPLQTKQALRVDAVHTFSFLKMFRKMGKSKLYISGGGTLMQDVTSTRSLLYYLQNIQMAKLRGNEVMLYGCGIGPVNGAKNQKRMARVLDKCADAITVRDDYSLSVLQKLHIDKPETYLTADPALLCSVTNDNTTESYLLSCGLEEGKKYMMFAVRPWKGFDEKAKSFAQAAEYVQQKYGLIPVFFAMEPNRDQDAVEMVAKLTSCPHLVGRASANPNCTMGLISHMTAVVSMRLHGLIFSAGLGVPTVGVVYDPKVSGFMDYMNNQRYCDLSAVNTETLCSLIDNALQSTASEQKMAEKLGQLAKKNAEIAEKLLKK